MKNVIISTDSLSVAQEIISGATASIEQVSNGVNWWLIVAIIELLVIICLLVARNSNHSKSKEQQLKESILQENIDFGNIVRSGFGASELYDRLKKQIHPDRFPNNPEKIAIATELMQLAGKNKHNLKVLEEIKKRACEELEIKL